MRNSSNLEYRKSSIDAVNSSCESLTYISYRSRKQDLMIYDSKRMYRSLTQAEKIIKKHKEIMIETEIDFLNKFINIFDSSRRHNTFNIKSNDYLNLIASALTAIEDRTDFERNIIIDYRRDLNIEAKIQFAFSIHYDILKDIKEKIICSDVLFLKKPSEIRTFAIKLQKVFPTLIENYIYEFEYLHGEYGFTMEDLNRFIDELLEQLSLIDNFEEEYKYETRLIQITSP